jgi:hypothetical protein
VIPERGWALLWGCDLAVAAMGLGLATGSHLPVSVGFVFHMSVGLPVFIVGLFTTHDPNLTSVAIHILPPIAGGRSVARRGLSRRTGLIGWVGFVVALVAGFVAAPPELNVNLMRTMWPPVAATFPSMAAYRIAFVAMILLLLVVGELALRRLFSFAPAPSPTRLPDTSR